MIGLAIEWTGVGLAWWAAGNADRSCSFGVLMVGLALTAAGASLA